MCSAHELSEVGVAGLLGCWRRLDGHGCHPGRALFLILGVVAVVGVYVADPRGVASTRSVSVIVALVGVEMSYAVLSGDLSADEALSRSGRR